MCSKLKRAAERSAKSWNRLQELCTSTFSLCSHLHITFATVVEEALKKGESTTQLQAHLFCAKMGRWWDRSGKKGQGSIGELEKNCKSLL
jgi:hypothetical protein